MKNKEYTNGQKTCELIENNQMQGEWKFYRKKGQYGLDSLNKKKGVFNVE